jgi:hypothetical protein
MRGDLNTAQGESQPAVAIEVISRAASWPNCDQEPTVRRCLINPDLLPVFFTQLYAARSYASAANNSVVY